MHLSIIGVWVSNVLAQALKDTDLSIGADLAFPIVVRLDVLFSIKHR